MPAFPSSRREGASVSDVSDCASLAASTRELTVAVETPVCAPLTTSTEATTEFFLEREHLDPLERIMCLPVRIHGENRFPPFPVAPALLCSTLARAICAAGISLVDVRLEGSTAAYCTTGSIDPLFPPVFRDFDFVFYLEGDDRADLSRMRSIVLSSLCTFLPESLRMVDEFSLCEAYVAKMFITPPASSPKDDAWSLITLRNEPDNPAIDLKFVQRISRPYQFSVDSLQIILTPSNLTAFSNLVFPAASVGPIDPPARTQVRTSCPGITVHNVLEHIAQKVIHVDHPRDMYTVFGGGLLKYCSLLTRGYKLDNPSMESELENAMAARFQINFPFTECSRHGMSTLIARVLSFIHTHIPSMHEIAAFLINLSGIFVGLERKEDRQISQALYQLAVSWPYLGPFVESQLSAPLYFHVPKRVLVNKTWGNINRQRRHSKHYPVMDSAMEALPAPGPSNNLVAAPVSSTRDDKQPAVPLLCLPTSSNDLTCPHKNLAACTSSPDSGDETASEGSESSSMSLSTASISSLPVDGQEKPRRPRQSNSNRLERRSSSPILPSRTLTQHQKTLKPDARPLARDLTNLDHALYQRT
eukprot:m.473396 g.473396  ORF g.473396 m.473396 type:complete len:588 (-) comp57121_c0_seq2:1729-3492(-)